MKILLTSILKTWKTVAESMISFHAGSDIFHTIKHTISLLEVKKLKMQNRKTIVLCQSFFVVKWLDMQYSWLDKSTISWNESLSPRPARCPYIQHIMISNQTIRDYQLLIGHSKLLLGTLKISYYLNFNMKNDIIPDIGCHWSYFQYLYNV